MTVKNEEEKILDLLERQNMVTTVELTELLPASEATVRRTLAQMEKNRQLVRIPGGAIRITEGRILGPQDEIQMNRRMLVNMEEKRRIAEKACEEIQDGECLFLDGGSSITPVIDFLKDRPVQIVTNNHLILRALDETSAAKAIVIGGDYLAQYAMSTGGPAIAQVESHTYDRCFLSCMGFDLNEDMTYTTESVTAEVKHAAARNSRRVVLLADHTKYKVHGFCKFMPVSGFDAIYTDLTGIELPDNFIPVSKQR